MLEPNENFEEALGMRYRSLTRSKLELLSEATSLAVELSNEPALTMVTKVELSLGLADLTQDVNHLLGALIYLL